MKLFVDGGPGVAEEAEERGGDANAINAKLAPDETVELFIELYTRSKMSDDDRKKLREQLLSASTSEESTTALSATTRSE